MLSLIANPREILKCQARLRAVLGKVLTKRTLTHVGYQGGGGMKRVWHNDQLWYAYRLDRLAPIPRYWNAFGLSLTKTTNEGIVVEVNPSIGGVTRVSGLFARNAEGEVFLMHTGKVGGGRKGVGKNAFEEFYQGEWVAVQGGPDDTIRAIPIGRLDDRHFVDNLTTFVREVELFKKSVAVGHADESAEFDRDNGEQEEIEADVSVGRVQKRQLILARIGQGRFRKNVERHERRCRITGVSAREHLRASHIKPWSHSSNREKLDGNNGLLLAPHIDHLFDRGFISFSDTGRVLMSPHLDKEVMRLWWIKKGLSVGTFNMRQKTYLSYHRRYVFLRQ